MVTSRRVEQGKARMVEGATVSTAGSDVAAELAAPIQSVERAATLLRIFLPNRGTLSLNEVAELTGWSTSTSHRYCSALRQAALLRYDHATGRYGLGGMCIELGKAAQDGLPIVEIARPLISELVNVIDQTVVLGVWDGAGVRIVEVNDNTSAITRVSVRLGSHLAPFVTAQGLLYLAYNRYIHQRHARAPQMDEVREAIEQARQDRCTFSSSAPGVRTVAAPIFRGEDIAATIAIVGVATEMPQTPESQLVTHLGECADRLSRLLTARR